MFDEESNTKVGDTMEEAAKRLNASSSCSRLNSDG